LRSSLPLFPIFSNSISEIPFQVSGLLFRPEKWQPCLAQTDC
jgi:hypothetical protein